MPASCTLLLVEDDPADALIAADVARTLGMNELRGFSSVSPAISFLEKCLEGRASLPCVILLDLDLGQESGYELIRMWRLTPTLSQIPLLVWSVLGQHHRELTEIFKVTTFVPKGTGKNALREGLLLCLEQKCPQMIR